MACKEQYGIVDSDISNRDTNTFPSVPKTKIPLVVCNIYCQCAHYQEGPGFQVRKEGIGGREGIDDETIPKELTNRQLKKWNYKAMAQKKH